MIMMPTQQVSDRDRDRRGAAGRPGRAGRDLLQGPPRRRRPQGRGLSESAAAVAAAAPGNHDDLLDRSEGGANIIEFQVQAAGRRASES